MEILHLKTGSQRSIYYVPNKWKLKSDQRPQQQGLKSQVSITSLIAWIYFASLLIGNKVHIDGRESFLSNSIFRLERSATATPSWIWSSGSSLVRWSSSPLAIERWLPNDILLPSSSATATPPWIKALSAVFLLPKIQTEENRQDFNPVYGIDYQGEEAGNIKKYFTSWLGVMLFLFLLFL